MPRIAAFRWRGPSFSIRVCSDPRRASIGPWRVSSVRASKPGRGTSRTRGQRVRVSSAAIGGRQPWGNSPPRQTFERARRSLLSVSYHRSPRSTVDGTDHRGDPPNVRYRSPGRDPSLSADRSRCRRTNGDQSPAGRRVPDGFMVRSQPAGRSVDESGASNWLRGSSILVQPNGRTRSESTYDS